MQEVQAAALALGEQDVRGGGDALAAARALGDAHASRAFHLGEELPLRELMVRAGGGQRTCSRW